MSGNYQKTPLVTSLTRHSRRMIDGTLELTGKALPASIVTMMGSIATVKFELTDIPWTLPQVTVPIAGSEYIRLPLQAGCKGVVFPADARLGPVSGLGGTTADLSKPGNLSALVFFPIGNKAWTAPEDPKQIELYGADGTLIKDSADKNFFIQIAKGVLTISNKSGSVIATNNGAQWEFKGPVVFDGLVTMQSNLQLAGNMLSQTGSTYAGNFETTGNVIAGGIGLKTHAHTSGNPGSPTSPPTTG